MSDFILRRRGKTMPEKRKRDVAHLWADKRIMRFFRRNFNKLHYKNLRSVYLALCEIDSDFRETGEITNFTRTVATYAGMNENTVRPYLRALCRADIIDYAQKNDGKFGGTILTLYAWEESEEEGRRERIARVLESPIRRTKEPPVRKNGETNGNSPFLGKPRNVENPLTGKPVNGVSETSKNNKLTLSKNPIGEEISLFPRSSAPEKPPRHSPSTRRPPISERTERALPLANRLADIVRSSKNIKITAPKIRAWANEIRKLVEIDGVSPERIEAALEWYSGSVGGQYIPVIESGNSLRNKFVRLEEAMKRAGYLPPSRNAEARLPSPQKLIKQHFPNDVLRKSFLEGCYKSAKRIFRADFEEGTGGFSRLAEKLLEFYDKIGAIQEKNFTPELRRALPDYGPMNVVQRYIAWIGENEDWITSRRLSMFEVNSGLFRDFCRRWAFEVDHLARSPLTGKPYRNENYAARKI